MKLNFTKALVLLLLLVQNVPSFSQRIINAVNTTDQANFNGWVNTPNPITGYVFSGATNRVGTSVATNGGLYAIPNRGLGYRPSSSANSFTLTGTYRNNTGAAIAVGDTIQVSYRAEVIDANSRIPGWDVTVGGQTNSTFNWLSTNGTQTKTHKFVRTTAIANNATFTLVFESDRGTGSGSSPLIGINNISVTILPAAAICATPSVSTQPADISLVAPNTATFYVSAVDVTSYQWQWRATASGNWANVTAAEGTGGTAATFTTVPTTQAMDGYQYRVVLTNTCGSTTQTLNTNAATLTMDCTNPVVTMQPLDTTVMSGIPAGFVISATDVSAYQWQWRANANGTWTDVTAAEGTGGTTDSFTTIATTAQMNGYQYRVVLTNTCGNTISDSATLTICMPPVVSMQPTDTIAVLGNVAVFEVAATNATAYQWQWRANANSNWADVTTAEGTGGTTDSFTTIATTAQMNGYQYRVVLTNSCGSTSITNIHTDSATLTICMPPTITTQVAHTTAVVGTSAVFEVAATNATAYQWQWRSGNTANWTDATVLEGTGGTTDSFTTIATTMTMNGYEYRVIVTNECGVNTVSNIVSDSGVLTVVCPPAAAISTQPAAITINLGANASFSVTATDADTYQWQTWDELTATWLDIAPAATGYTGQNTNTLIITTPGLAMDSSKYRVLVTNLCAVTTTSGEAMLTIDAGITVTTSPVSLLSTDGFTSLTVFTNTGIGQQQSEGVRYSEDGITWNPLVAGGVISGLQPNKQYYYQGYVTFDIGTFYGAVLDTVTLANVAGATTLNALAGGTTIALTLNENNNPAYTQYAIASGTSWVQANGTLGNAVTWMTAADWNAINVSELIPGTNYCFAVKARNNAGVETILGAEICIMTDTSINVSVGDIAAALNSQIAVYPNPSTSGYVHLKYSFATAIDLDVNVTDLSGKIIFTTGFKSLKSGQQTLDLSKLTRGMYFLKLSAEGQSVARKIMISK